MTTASVTNILAGIVTVALVTTVVTSPRSAAVIKALGNFFQGSIRAAMGN